VAAARALLAGCLQSGRGVAAPGALLPWAL